MLRPVFANPYICKVFHGASSDIGWLQRDFHIYVVNLFDTAKASEVLWKQMKSFAYLLEKYCGVFKDRALQRGDWRPRPLSTEKIQYARTDSHYLLPVASCLVSELKKNSADLVLETIRGSNVACLQLYMKDTKDAYHGEYKANSIITRYLNNQGSFHYNVCDTKLCSSCLPKFQSSTRRLCAWREIMARVHDESLNFILSDEAIGALATTLPTTEIDMYGTICTADNSASPSPVVCSHIEDFDLLMSPDSSTKDDDLCHTILQRHLGSNGSCPLSMYNGNLLSNTIPRFSNRPIPKPNGSSDSKRRAAWERSRCKSPAYHHCRILANDGQFLSYCSQKKIKWYLNQNIAELVEDDPPTIMLLFEPKGRNYISDKKNICVGCTEENNYARYRIIPPSYLKEFPAHLKCNFCQDIVLLCRDCYATVDVACKEYKQRIATEFGIPLEGRLEKKRLALPHSTGQECSKQDDEVTSENPKDEVTNLASSLDFGWLSHGKLVVEYILSESGEDGILQFCQRWRQVLTNALHLDPEVEGF